uniref:NADH dehydrogenase subunit 1 n=1 Tax=Rhizophysa eysenhardtii TaxID=2721092 RepID=UPI0026E1FC58|nr:NADH dehydrogenase subunit 1 [Rhizophysa eysenhardtii]WJJ69945.1 NADH dehydrogenase subunit 1 [Rhizophysa eysenhardtii]
MDQIVFFIFEIIKFLIIILPVLISVAYLTLAERKILSYTQTRKGPNVVGIYGLLQPLADGVKLFSKEMVIPNHVNIFLYFFSPILALGLSLIVWSLLPLGCNTVMGDINLSLLLIFAFSSIGVYAILMSGWASNSKYAFIGALRAAAQMISYEVCIGLIIINVILCVGAFNLNSILVLQNNSVWFLLPLLPAALMFFISCLAETNRAPFDLTEGESELVSGYNVEYSSMSFALFFLAEYSHIIFMSFLFTIIFLGGSKMLFLFTPFLFLKASFVIFSFIWVRTSFPRIRYDQLMHLLWKTYLPMSLALVIVTNSILWFLNGLPPKICI